MEKDGLAKSSDTSIEKEGLISQNLSKDGIPNQSLANDHLGIENISVEPGNLYEAVSILKSYGFNYLQCQGGYDEGPGKSLVSFYHLISLDDFIITNFVKGAGVETLPTAIFGAVKQGIKPNIMALSSLLLLFSIPLVTLSYFIGKRGEQTTQLK